MLNLICDQCDRKFKSKAGLSIHKLYHDPNYKEKVRLSIKKGKDRNKGLKIKRYLKNPNYCAYCKSILNYKSRDNKHCSTKCASLSIVGSKLSELTKSRISKSLKGKRGPDFKIKTCEFCYQNYKEFNFRKRKVFSWGNPKCESELKTRTSLKISKGLKLAFKEGRHLGNFYRNRSQPSYLESSFIDYLKLNYPSINYEFNKTVKIFDKDGNYKNNYYIDFYFPETNIGIELDGRQHFDSVEYDKNRDKDIFKSIKCKILRVSYDEYFEKSKLSNIISILQKENKLQLKN